jgi:hypothetical protein
MEAIAEELTYLLELMTKINQECNQVIYKQYDSIQAIKNIKHLLGGVDNEV